MVLPVVVALEMVAERSVRRLLPLLLLTLGLADAAEEVM